MHSELTDEKSWFPEARYGLFIHYGLYSSLGRGEWVWNREEFSREGIREFADKFTAEAFDAEAICDLAVRSGMRYVVFTTMHHEGFRLYPTELSDLHIGNSGAKGRDLVGEVVAAAKARGLRVGLYHSLNNWYDEPDAVSALEDPAAREEFQQATLARIRELVERYNPVDTLWYDGWWPFDAEGWKAEEMNDMVLGIQPHILVNGRNGLPGDFSTPEGHLGSPRPWRPWEGCMTLNDSWGFHVGDNNWKTPGQVVDLLVRCSQQRGNLLLNIGPRGDGSIPEESVSILETVGEWLQRNGDAIYETEPFTFDAHERGEHRGDWNSLGPITLKGNSLFWILRRHPGDTAVLGGVETPVTAVSQLDNGKALEFRQEGTRLEIHGLGETADPIARVLKIDFSSAPMLYKTAGLRVPRVPHPHYDPCPSDIQY